jgi:hypothetical protein
MLTPTQTGYSPHARLHTTLTLTRLCMVHDELTPFMTPRLLQHTAARSKHRPRSPFYSVTHRCHALGVLADMPFSPQLGRTSTQGWIPELASADSPPEMCGKPLPPPGHCMLECERGLRAGRRMASPPAAARSPSAGRSSPWRRACLLLVEPPESQRHTHPCSQALTHIEANATGHIQAHSDKSSVAFVMGHWARTAWAQGPACCASSGAVAWPSQPSACLRCAPPGGTRKFWKCIRGASVHMP